MDTKQINGVAVESLECDLYKILFESIDEGYCVIEMHIEPNEPLDYKFIEINKHFESISTLVNAKGKWMRELRPGHEESWFKIYRDVALTGQPIRFENRGKELDDRWFSLYAFRVGRPEQRRVAVLFSDITDRKMAEEKELALRKSEERWRLALDAVDFGTWELDLITGTVFHNLRHDQIFGYKELQTSWTLKKTLQHVLPQDRQRVRAAYEQPDDKEGMSLETRIRWNDGSTHWINLRGQFHYDSEGYPIRIIGIISEITERKEAEQALKDSESRLRELNATKDKFFSIIAHDLKSPFNSTIGFSEILIDRIENHDYEDVEKYADIIHQSSLRAINLLTNLFEWAKLQKGKMEFRPMKNDIVSVINEAIELLNDTALQKSIVISRHTPNSLFGVFDVPMISTVIRNLISNAIKFTNEGGNIVISALQKEKELLISVNDNGIGIKPVKIDKLFRIDESISTAGTNGEEGTGLGLVLCKEFVTRHSGRIWAESKVGMGSKFIFTLPLVTYNQLAEMPIDYYL